ncbi:MAG: hypothetical protein HC925_00020 [Coleofasciculaceae cyanobacterium SM2_3_26]|nr:hypothetical protein [Coleofasciculaceae cyanobacterium SM2_3_26]
MAVGKTATALNIGDKNTASAFYAGFAEGPIVAAANEWMEGILDKLWVSATKIMEGLRRLKDQFWGLAQQGWNFLTGWFKEDPAGATAGVVAGILTLGVVIVVGGAIIGALAGGLKALAAVAALVVPLALTIGAPILRRIINWLVGGVLSLYSFNWNLSDEEIRQQQEGNLLALSAIAGESAGQMLGSLVCGYLPGLALFKFNPVKFAKLKELLTGTEDSELFDQIRDAAQSLFLSTTQIAARMLMVEAYKNVRAWIKGAARAYHFQRK